MSNQIQISKLAETRIRESSTISASGEVERQQICYYTTYAPPPTTNIRNLPSDVGNKPHKTKIQEIHEKLVKESFAKFNLLLLPKQCCW